MIYELRQYVIAPGKRAQWVRLMDQEIIPFQESMGMRVVGSFTSVEQDDLYVWIRSYDDLDHKQALYDKVYGSAYWQDEIRPKIDPLLQREQSQVTLLQPTNHSLLK